MTQKRHSFEIASSNKCTGCTACASICPISAISMISDKRGFLQPKIDSKKCVGCGACSRVCPILKDHTSVSPLEVWAAKAKLDVTRQTSASGGVFTALALKVLDEGGVVYGAGWNSDLTVSHQRTESKAGLAPLRGSKYVQSDLRGTFKKVKEDLAQGRKVLFSGTPCQIAGLKSYLGKSYDNLILVSLICHSITSPDTWKWFLEEVAGSAGSTIKSVCFRDKCDGGDGHLMSIRFEDETKDIVTNLWDNPYAYVFFNLLNTREACFDCKFRSNKCGADIVIGDYWGIREFHPEFEDGRGISALIVLTSRGKTILEGLPSLEMMRSTYPKVLVGNPYLESSVKRNIRGAKRFLSKCRKTSFVQAIDYATRAPWYYRCYRFMRHEGGAILRRLKLR